MSLGKLRTAIRILLPIGLMVLIFLFSHQPGGESGRLSTLILMILRTMGLDLPILFGEYAGFMVRKMAHFTEYGILSVLIFRAVQPYFTLSNALLLGWVVATLYASTDEFHQTFIPGRVGNVGDVAIDSLGAMGYMVITWFLFRPHKRARHK